ncbi:TPR domain-containing glycosyltransferase [Oceanirhabdus sp. W0125-5]|uniref:TPR domain-containing glycosyltransferase n=1 Tax=Oceanirhabdus sp. W0125-5 TaxID=2999116 RepID=UPI0022F2A7EE|nr:TPR domain-containing glycosyltransferase [Oceanirhabdus sp. W0125-5]WBW96577.1 glycosyltransferase [Oceanirhabdus sp. W0125-5]
MIVKNEEDNLERCLKSAEGIADEIIIVDTGSSDSTVEIAKKYTPNVYFFKWINDFSAARNFSLSKATGDWILILDADDELKNNQKDYIRELTTDTSIDVYCFNTLNIINENDKKNIAVNLNPRLFQNKPGYKYEGAVHNQLISVIKRVNPNLRIKNAPVDIYHYGYLHSIVEKKHKRERNMEILKGLLEKDPDDTFNLFNMGSEHYALGNYKEAFNYYLKSYELIDPKNNFYPMLVLRMSLCCKSLKSFDQFYHYAETALEHYPTFTALYYLRGCINYYLGKPTLAIDDFEKALSLGESDTSLTCIKGAGNFRPLELLCKIYYEFKDYKKCAYYCTELISYPEVSDFDSLRTIVHCLYKLKASTEEIEEILKLILNSKKEKDYIYICNILIEEKDYNLAFSYADKGMQNLKSKDIPEEMKADLISKFTYFKGICEFHNKNYEESLSLLMNLNNKQLLELTKPYLLLLGIYLKDDAILKTSISTDGLIGKVCNSLYALITGYTPEILTSDEKHSITYQFIILNIFEILLDIKENKIFDKALGLLDLISSKDIHLNLGKLYYKYDNYPLSKNELMKSIAINNLIDEEGSRILYNLNIKEP